MCNPVPNCHDGHFCISCFNYRTHSQEFALHMVTCFIIYHSNFCSTHLLLLLEENCWANIFRLPNSMNSRCWSYLLSKLLSGVSYLPFFIDRVALSKQGDNVLGSVRPSVCLSITVHSHGSVSNNCADAVDRLLMF